MLLKRYFSYSNPFSRMTMLQNWGLLMFYCSDFLKDAGLFFRRTSIDRRNAAGGGDASLYGFVWTGRRSAASGAAAVGGAGGKTGGVRLFS